jgi:hypothetical protein
MSFQRGDMARMNNSYKVVEVVSVRPSGVHVYNKNTNEDMIVNAKRLTPALRNNRVSHRRGNRKTRRNRRGNNKKTRRSRR